jgi:hypothetical protein
MTPNTDDVARLVAQLRAISGYPIFRSFAGAITSLRIAADLLSSQAKALREADSRYNTAVGSRHEWRHAAEVQERRADAAETRLKEAEKVIENLYEWYDVDGSVGGSSSVFEGNRAFLNTPEK